MFECKHEATSLRYKTDSLSRRLYVMQCDRCHAAVGNFIPHAKVDQTKARPFVEEMADLSQRKLFP